MYMYLYMYKHTPWLSLHLLAELEIQYFSTHRPTVNALHFGITFVVIVTTVSVFIKIIAYH